MKANWDNLYTHALFFDQEDATTRYESIKNNIFYDNKNILNATRPIIVADGSLPTQETMSNNWLEAGNPKFVNIFGTPDPMNQTQFDFHLQSNSSCIDAGDFLTTITNTSGSGTSFTVADAGYFMDGWGIIEGDSIQLEGQAQRVKITNVDYNANIITVDAPLTWTQNKGINLAYEGFAPDIGAYEYINSTLAQCIHKSDISPCDGCVSMSELTSFIDRWKLDNQDVRLRELIEAIGLWKRGC